MMADGRGGDRRQRVCFSGLRDFERLRPLLDVHTREISITPERNLRWKTAKSRGRFSYGNGSTYVKLMIDT